MNLGEALIIGAAFLSFLSFISRAYAIRYPDRKTILVSQWLSILTFILLSSSMFLLVYMFLTSNFEYFYVWSYSSTDLPILYKLSGVWAGAEGSFFLWIWLMSLTLTIEIAIERKREYLSEKFHSVFQATISGIIFLFILILLPMNLFEETSNAILMLLPNGNGLNLLLQTPEMAIHPPIVFAAYAFGVVGFAAGFAYLVTKENNWFTVAFPWTRLSWLFLTLGIGIGAIWAYYVSGWRGYWGWDPVETISLIPWFVLTAFLHTLIRFSRKGEYQILAPALGMISLISILFATFATRAGSIWSASVHAFFGGVGDSAIGRLFYLLENDSSILGIFLLMITLLILTIYVSYSRYATIPKGEEPEEPERISEYVSDRNNMILTVILLTVTAAMMMILMIKNVDVSQAANYDEFNQKMSFFFVGLMVALTLCLIWKFVGKELAFLITVILIIASIILAIVAAITDFVNWIVVFSLPSFIFAVGASCFKLIKSRVPRSLRRTLQNMGPHIVHLGVALILISFVVSTHMQTLPSNLTPTGDYEATYIGEEIQAGDYSLRLVDLNERTENVIGGQIIYQEATVALLKSGNVITDNWVLTNVLSQQIGANFGKIEQDISVYKTVLTDIYINYEWRDNISVFIQVKLIPLMNTLWGGLILLAIGISIRTIAWKTEPKKAEVPVKPKRKVSEPIKAPHIEKKADYEALVEEELKKFKEKKLQK